MKIVESLDFRGVRGTCRAGKGGSCPLTNPAELVTFPNHGPSCGGSDAEMEFGVQQDDGWGLPSSSILCRRRSRLEDRKT